MNKKPVDKVTESGVVVHSYSSVAEAAKENNINYSTLLGYIDSSKLYKGFMYTRNTVDLTSVKIREYREKLTTVQEKIPLLEGVELEANIRLCAYYSQELRRLKWRRQSLKNKLKDLR